MLAHERTTQKLCAHQPVSKDVLFHIIRTWVYVAHTAEARCTLFGLAASLGLCIAFDRVHVDYLFNLDKSRRK